jgi:hypothetical protein
MRDAMVNFSQVNGGVYPCRIVVYRDGVSDGQFDRVSEHEIPQIEEAFGDIRSYYPEFQ